MKRSSAGVCPRQVEDILVASIRFRGGYEQVPEYFYSLRQQVESHVDGPAILLHHYFDEALGAGHDLEVCYPVSEAVVTADTESRILEGGDVLQITHTGARQNRAGEEGMDSAWLNLYAYVRQHGVILNPGPKREVHLEEQHGAADASTNQVTELQLPIAFYRLDRLAEGLERYSSRFVQRQVMQGSAEYPSRSLPENAEWFREVVERLDAAVDDEGARRAIMNECADRFPLHRIRTLRAEYHRSGDIDEILQIMRADRTLGDLSWYEQPVREGGIVYVTKDPALPEAYERAADKREKRACYCHCGLMRDLIRSGQTVSGTYCHCGAGWYHQLWEGILGEPVAIDVVESVLQGDNRCTFAIHLPGHHE